MSSHLFMGAINKLFADKKKNYMSPYCNKDVIFKNRFEQNVHN